MAVPSATGRVCDASNDTRLPFCIFLGFSGFLIILRCITCFVFCLWLITHAGYVMGGLTDFLFAENWKLQLPKTLKEICVGECSAKLSVWRMNER